MLYKTRRGQVSSGEAIGILLLDTSVPFIPGDVANATTYTFPVRFQKVRGFTVARALSKDPAVYEELLPAAKSLAISIREAKPKVKIVMGGHAAVLARDTLNNYADVIVDRVEDAHALSLKLVDTHA